MTLIARYESLRAKEHDALHALVDTLGKVDGLPAEQMDQARDALFHADHPFLIVLMGAFNTGKSSIINALLGDQALGVGPTPTTNQIVIIRHGPALQRVMTGETDTLFHPSKLLEQVSLVDTPGVDSIFTDHDAMTDRFLHRSDIVLLVMLATQAMSQSNADYLRSLRAYGKRIILVVNQIDLLDEAERTTLHDFISQQAKTVLETEPEVWMVSAKLATQARQSQARDGALWEASGFGQIERFILQALSDGDRVRGKLETPLQIMRNVCTVALAQVRDEQNALASYRKSAQNVTGQIEQGARDQQSTLNQTLSESDKAFDETIQRGQSAIRAVFQLSRAPRLTGGGALNLIGVAQIGRRLGQRTPARTAFEAAKVDEPLDKLPLLIEALGPRIEGRDLKDLDDLVTYTRREISALPDFLQNKLVGKLEVPTSYDRSILPAARPSLLAILNQAKAVEFGRIDKAVQSTLIVLAFYEIIVLVLAVVYAISFGSSTNGGAWVLLVILTLVLMGAGLGFVPVRGVFMARSYEARLSALRAQFRNMLTRAAEQQIGVGARLRQDAVTPFMRLVDSQTNSVDALKTELERHQQTLTGLEKELTALRG